MELNKNRFRLLAYGVVVFITLGIAIANETLSRFGLENNYIVVFSLALILAALMLSKNFFMLMIIIVGVIAMNLPDATLVNYHLDRDVLLAAICAFILVPSVYALFGK